MQVRIVGPDRLGTALAVAAAASRSPSDDRWLRGTTAFVVLPGSGEPGPITIEGRRRCRAVQTIARRGRGAKDVSLRASLYGEPLATCAACRAATPPPTARLQLLGGVR